MLAFIVLVGVSRADEERDPLPLGSIALKNGLDVVFAPDPSVSSVVVLVQYEGGAGRRHSYFWTARTSIEPVRAAGICSAQRCASSIVGTSIR